MTSFICHVVGVAKRVRLERFVRRDHPAEVKRPQDRLSRSLDSPGAPRELSAANSPKPHPLGRQCIRVHAPHAATEADERADAMLECAICEVPEAGRPKPAPTGVEWQRDATDPVTRFSSSFDAPNNYVNQKRLLDHH